MSIIRNYFNKSAKEYTEEELKKFENDAILVCARDLFGGCDPKELLDIIRHYEVAMAEKAKFLTSDIRTPERISFRENLVKSYFEQFRPLGHDKIATIILGQIATGKSTLVDKIEKESGAVAIDVDFFKYGRGPNYRGMIDEMENGEANQKTYLECSNLAKDAISFASKQGWNIITPKTGHVSYKNFYQGFVEPLVENGYQINFVFTEAGLNECVERDYKRFFKGYQREDGSARLVPLETIYDVIDDNPYRTFCSFKRVSEEMKNEGVESPYAFEAFSSANVGIGEELNVIDMETMQEKYCRDIENDFVK